MQKYLEFNNISTILTSIFLTIFGLMIGYAASHGLHFPFTAETLTSIAVGFILAVFSYYNAKHQNSFFDKEGDVLRIPVENLTDDQVAGINAFIKEAINSNTNEIEEVDPALEYEEEVQDGGNA